MPPVPAQLRHRPAVRPQGRLQDRTIRRDQQLFRPSRRGRLPARLEGQRHDLLRMVQPALRLLPELRDQPARRGRDRLAATLAAMMLRLQAGLPQHQLRHARARGAAGDRGPGRAVERGLRLPLVYNTGAYDSMEACDCSTASSTSTCRTSSTGTRSSRGNTSRPPTTPQPRGTRSARCIARSATSIRRAGPRPARPAGAPPGHARLSATRTVLRFLAERVWPGTYVSLMAQYYPSNKVAFDRYPDSIAASRSTNITARSRTRS